MDLYLIKAVGGLVKGRNGSYLQDQRCGQQIWMSS